MRNAEPQTATTFDIGGITYDANGIAPVRDNLDRLVPAAEVCSRISRTRNTLNTWCKSGIFPPPVMRVRGGPAYWRESDINGWFRALRPLSVDEPIGPRDEPDVELGHPQAGPTC